MSCDLNLFVGVSERREKPQNNIYEKEKVNNVKCNLPL